MSIPPSSGCLLTAVVTVSHFTFGTVKPNQTRWCFIFQTLSCPERRSSSSNGASFIVYATVLLCEKLYWTILNRKQCMCASGENEFTSKSRRALAKAPTSSFSEKMQEITSDFLLVSSSRYMEPLLLCWEETIQSVHGSLHKYIVYNLWSLWFGRICQGNSYYWCCRSERKTDIKYRYFLK